MSTDTMQRRLDNVIGSIESRTWLVGQYISESAVNPQPITRSILPFRVYRSRQGELVLDGFDTYRRAVRTFLLDHFTRLARNEQHQNRAYAADTLRLADRIVDYDATQGFLVMLNKEKQQRGLVSLADARVAYPHLPAVRFLGGKNGNGAAGAVQGELEMDIDESEIPF